MTGHSHLRAVGVRIDYDAVPARVRDWVEQELGAPVVQAVTQRGGMSPGCAVRVRLADGRRAFVKAVGLELNADTAGLHRHEAMVLAALPDVSWRPRLLATYDDGDWVALVLEDVEGVHPDWRDDGQVGAVLAQVEAQAVELSPSPVEQSAVPTLLKNLAQWAEVLDGDHSAPRDVLPAWFRDNRDLVASHLEALSVSLHGTTLCQWDIRSDNILIRPDGSVVLIDWGISRLGPVWADTVVFALEWAETPRFDQIVSASPLLAAADDDPASGLLLGKGGFLTVAGTWDAPPGLPTLPAFRSREGRRLLEGARRRLGL
ncbi:phosphotransferase family protein [Oryzihumus leptocrescens]|uniref:Phosphotransferase family enzyme n=1 Tax=Oryzihumus leptocrescens TaxID=297536 RepID=A0A542ZMC4_9MICO|nr:phosphotransferase [Oryzihumus leptocrescens]TQL61498.1 phosphotransferase family enzyme [Oryzihumus leptocrescens]